MPIDTLPVDAMRSFSPRLPAAVVLKIISVSLLLVSFFNDSISVLIVPALEKVILGPSPLLLPL